MAIKRGIDKAVERAIKRSTSRKPVKVMRSRSWNSAAMRCDDRKYHRAAMNKVGKDGVITVKSRGQGHVTRSG